jgi:hypothetical protein
MTISGLIFIIVAAVVILVLISLSSKSSVHGKGIDSAHFKNEWNDCVEQFQDEKTRGLSLINADKLLDDALKCLGHTGDTMAERLVSAKNVLKNKDEVWSAHKIRNRLVHETNYHPTEKIVKRSLNGYYRAFKDLGVF